MTPEGKVKEWFKTQLKKKYPRAKRIRWPAGQYGTVGVSDDICCIEGKFIAIEAKADITKDPTRIQAQFLLDVWEAGGLGLVLRGKDFTIFEHIDDWVNHGIVNIKTPKSIQDLMINL